jgi:chemotaxis protein MotB
MDQAVNERESQPPASWPRLGSQDHEREAPAGCPGRWSARARLRKAAMVWVIAGGGSAAGCVTTETFDAKVAEMQQITTDHDKAAADREATLKTQVASLTKQKSDLETRVMTCLAGHEDMKKALAETQARLDELRQEKTAAMERAATFRKLTEKLRSMIESHLLRVSVRDGRMQIALDSDVLFDSGSTDIKPAGQTALSNLAPVLVTISNRRYLVVGHTDDVPIHTARFPSNWELSTARAVEVVRLLIGDGVDPKQLSAAGAGEFDPLVANDTPEHRAQNRRIEIVLQPNLSDLPSLAPGKRIRK